MRPEKQIMLDEIRGQVAGSPFVVLTDYTGLSVANFTDLRKQLASARAECHVVKNTLLMRALTEAGLPKPSAGLTGMTAMVIGSQNAEITEVAKILKKFSKDTSKGKVKLGFMGQTTLTADEVLSLADLPSRDELRARVIGLLKAPAQKLAVVVGAPASQLARVLKAYSEKPAA
ncbi:MAG: 50S ribosomal protein L10 [Verrucomicrobiae bacterium]|nr:50S ribosomal protein L10 [Verrucomicrobiae bacterium]MDW8344581.1 50S ribosomal protein L10 [Verrucomicrobiae bacterium]